MKIALTIAGSDSGGGAGIQADLKTFAALGVYGTSALTAVTAQNTLGVTGVQELSPDMVALQIDAVSPTSARTPLRPDAGQLRHRPRGGRQGYGAWPPEPGSRSRDGGQGGDPLLQEAAVDALRTLLVPLALVVTPNLPEASVLVGYRVATLEQARRAARDIVGMGSRSVVVKGDTCRATPWTYSTTARNSGSSHRPAWRRRAPTARDAPSPPPSPRGWPKAWG